MQISERAQQIIAQLEEELGYRITVKNRDKFNEYQSKYQRERRAKKNAAAERADADTTTQG